MVRRRKRKLDTSSDLLNAVDQYHTKYDETKLDYYFSIQPTGENQYMMGDKVVVIDENSNIHVGGVKYEGTPGLWALVMMKSPTPRAYTHVDLTNYRDLVGQTNVMNHPRNIVEGRSRPKATYKWRHILEPLQQKQQTQRLDEDADNEHGDGVVQFLPGDIKGLSTKLNLLLAEYAAGNKSTLTRNEIVSILDELLRRKQISRKEYTDINTYLSRCL